MSKWVEFSKTGPKWLDGQEWQARMIPRPQESAPATSEPQPIKRRLFGRGEKATMTTKVETVRIKILRDAASSRWSVSQGQVLDLAEDIADGLVRSGSARLARDNEPVSYQTEYLPE